MNRVTDLNGNMVIFGDSFLIKERVSEGHKELILHAAGEKHLLARGPKNCSFSSKFPCRKIADFSEV